MSIPVTFEVLEGCCAEVVIGDSIIWEHNVFEDDAYSVFAYASENEIDSLAPFDLVKNWQRKLNTVRDHITRSGTGDTSPQLPLSFNVTYMNQMKKKQRIDTIATPPKTDDGRPGTMSTRSARQRRTRRNKQSDNADWSTIWG